MITSYHALELEVPEQGGLVRFQYKIPELSGVLTGIAPLVMGVLPRGSRGQRTGTLTLEALDRKIHLATLPVFCPGLVSSRQEFYPLEEDLTRGQLVNGSYLDSLTTGIDFTPYRLKVLFRVRI